MLSVGTEVFLSGENGFGRVIDIPTNLKIVAGTLKKRRAEDRDPQIYHVLYENSQGQHYGFFAEGKDMWKVNARQAA